MTAELEHVWFGLMRMPEGTIKTREAGSKVIFLTDMLDEAERRAYAVACQKVREPAREGAAQAGAEEPLTDEELRNVARVVGLGAVKYNDLSRDRQSLVTFTWDKALSLSGKHGALPAIRLRPHPLHRAQGWQGDVAGGPGRAAQTPSRRASCSARPSSATWRAASSGGRRRSRPWGGPCAPHLLADYLYELATAFSTFYAEHPVLKAEPAVRASRLLLADLVARVLAEGLGLLGIEVLERM